MPIETVMHQNIPCLAVHQTIRLVVVLKVPDPVGQKGQSCLSSGATAVLLKKT